MQSPRFPSGGLARAFEQAFGGAPAPVGAARAPGRVNVIGEHTDYNGGLVLPAAISLETRVRARLRNDDRVRAVSRERGEAEAGLGEPAAGSWLDYVRGVGLALAEIERVPRLGFELAVESDVPEGAGLSSSAALGVAVAHALAAAAGAPFAPSEAPDVARLCHRAESGFVGVPCGIMDQYASACGAEGVALLLDCATLDVERVSLGDDLAFLVVDTGVRRELRGGGYEERVRECERARSQAEAVLRRPLANLSAIAPAEWAELEPHLDPAARARAHHVIGENLRVRAFVAAVRSGDLAAAGAQLYASHESLAGSYEVSWPEADRLVERSRGLPGMIGARMTGAGWGGCTLHVVRAEALGPCARALCADAGARHWELRPGPGAGPVSIGTG